MAEAISRNNQSNLMNVLKKCMENQSNDAATTDSPATSVSSKASRYQVSKPNNSFEPEEQEQVPQMSMLIPNKRNRNKHLSKKEEPARTDQVKDVNIDNVGQAAEWLEKGTKEDDEFQQKKPAMLQNSLTASIRQKMQNKANQIMDGTYRQPRIPTSQDLIQKATMLRENNERRVRPQVSTIDSQFKSTDSQERTAHTQANALNSTVLDESVPHAIPTAQLQPPLRDLEESAVTRITKPVVLPDVVDDEDSRWDQINKQTMNEKKEVLLTKKDYTREEIEQYYLKRDVGTQKKAIQAELDEQKDSGYFDLFKACMGITNKPKESTIRLQLLALSKLQITSDQDVFLLEATWKLLKATPFNRYGKHWEQVGFQGRDPATDLRSTGVLSLLMMYMLGQRLPQYFLKVYSGSTDCIFQFPFAISIVKIAGAYLKLLKKGKIAAETFQQYCQWFEAICYNVFEKLLKSKLMITEFGIVMTKLLDEAQMNLKEILKAYKAAALT